MKKQDAVVMPKKVFVKEHKHLIKLLSNPNTKALKKEAKAQKKELYSMLRMTQD
jgi:hypothetical protein